MALFSSNPAQTERLPLLTQEQQNLQNQSLGSIQNILANLSGNKFGESPLAKQAIEHFHTQVVPSIAHRFSAMGDTQRSGAFESALGRAGAGLSQGLASLEQGNQLNLLNSLLSLGMQPSFESYYRPETPSDTSQFTSSLGGSLAQLAPSVAGALLPGGFSALAGLIPALLSLFGGNKTTSASQPTSQTSQTLQNARLPQAPLAPQIGSSNPLAGLQGISGRPLPRTAASLRTPSKPATGLAQTLGLLNQSGLNPLPTVNF